MKGRLFPYIPANNWWTLRKKFKERLPHQLTIEYVSTHLNKESEAAKNIFPDLRKIGLIDEELKPTVLAQRWCNDKQYAEVCEEIRTIIYPQELLDIYPNPDTSYSSVVRWFQTKTGLKQNSARSMASFYTLLSRAIVDPFVKTKNRVL